MRISYAHEDSGQDMGVAAPLFYFDLKEPSLTTYKKSSASLAEGYLGMPGHGETIRYALLFRIKLKFPNKIYTPL